MAGTPSTPKSVVRVADIVPAAATEAAMPGLLEVEHHRQSWRIAVWHSETDADFLWLSDDHMDEVVAAAAPVIAAQATTTERERIIAWLRAEAEARTSLLGTYSGDDALCHAADLLGDTPHTTHTAPGATHGDEQAPGGTTGNPRTAETPVAPRRRKTMNGQWTTMQTCGTCGSHITHDGTAWHHLGGTPGPAHTPAP